MPVLARVYHEPPTQQHRLTLRQVAALEADFQQLQRQAAELEM